MRISRLLLIVVAAWCVAAVPAHAGLMGTYYNLPSTHPDMETTITGWLPGMVENTLSGSTPTLTAYGATKVSQFDWWNSAYAVGSRVDSDADLQSNFAGSWFPSIVNDGLPGDPQHFAVHWSGSFYVGATKDYTYTMGSDDDSWLFIDGQLALDLGGIHPITYDNQTINLAAGDHTIDIFFAERHTVQSGFQLNFFTDLRPTEAVPEPGTLVLLGLGFTGLAARLRRRRNTGA